MPQPRIQGKLITGEPARAHPRIRDAARGGPRRAAENQSAATSPAAAVPQGRTASAAFSPAPLPATARALLARQNRRTPRLRHAPPPWHRRAWPLGPAVRCKEAAVARMGPVTCQDRQGRCRPRLVRQAVVARHAVVARLARSARSVAEGPTGSHGVLALMTPGLQSPVAGPQGPGPGPQGPVAGPQGPGPGPGPQGQGPEPQDPGLGQRTTAAAPAGPARCRAVPPARCRAVPPAAAAIGSVAAIEVRVVPVVVAARSDVGTHRLRGFPAVAGPIPLAPLVPVLPTGPLAPMLPVAPLAPLAPLLPVGPLARGPTAYAGRDSMRCAAGDLMSPAMGLPAAPTMRGPQAPARAWQRTTEP